MTPPLRIAVADDEPDMRDYFLRMLPRRGHQVVAVAASGEELVQRCEELKPDLVITDVKMPGMDGIAAANEICSKRPIPVILMSAHYDEESPPRTDRQLIFLRKPFIYSDLESAIEAAMSGAYNSKPSSNGKCGP
jgi:response regulator NasT